jgi:hypothetical protein
VKAANFYSKIFSKIKEFVSALELNSVAVGKLKNCLESTNLESDLFHIYKYEFLIKSITRLEAAGLSVEEQLAVLENVKMKLKGDIREKLIRSLEKNPDIYFFSTVTLDEKIKCMYCPLTSVDVERSFSQYKYILSDRRNNLSEGSLLKLNVIQFNRFIEIENTEMEVEGE